MRSAPTSIVLLAAALRLAAAQSSSTTSTTASAGLGALAPSPAPLQADPIATIIAGLNLLPDGLVSAAAGYVVSLGDTYQTAIYNDLVSDLTNSSLLKITNPELYYSYGRSPPVYPSPQGNGAGDWADAYEKARALVAQMTNEEKNNITIPSSDTVGCSGFSGSVPRLNFPGLCLNDAESGVRVVNATVNGYPAQLSVGASWNTTLAYARAVSIGEEFKAMGINVALGPVVGPLGRIALGGRNWEGFTNDPYLAGSLVDPTVRGLQENVIACVKHFIGNEQETNRNPFLQGFLQPIGINLNNSVSSNIDDRAMHELYLWPFYDAVKAGAGSVMASYNRINNSYATQNSKTLNGLLKTELGFQGFALSDWDALHTGVASANAGLDMVMPSGFYWGTDILATAVKNGSMTSSRLDDMATRIVAAWYKLAPFQAPGVTPHLTVDARSPGADAILLQSAIEGHVLVKNTNVTLPFKKPKVLSLFGYDAISGLNTSATDPVLYPFGLTNTRNYPDGSPFGDLNYLLFAASLEPGGVAFPPIALNGTMITGGGSGAIVPVSLTSPYDALAARTAADATTLHTDFVSTAPAVSPDSDACLVLINAQSSEQADRNMLSDSYSDSLVLHVASQCANTIVVIHNAGIRLVDAFAEHPNVTAILYAHLPGMLSGPALVDILYGAQSPSGRLPYTVARNASDYGALLGPTLPSKQDPQYSQSDFTEGVRIDYRHFLAHNITPRYAFGHGLTYSTFTYTNLSIVAPAGNLSALPPDAKSGIAPEGGLMSLYTPLASVSATITNSGPVAAQEVAQLYLGIPGSGVPRALRGFAKVALAAGESQTVTFELRRRDLSVWDAESQEWRLGCGCFEVRVGKSVLAVELEGSFEVA